MTRKNERCQTPYSLIRNQETIIKFKQLFAFALLFSGIAAAGNHEAEVGAVIDDFHDAAALGDKVRYLDHLTEDAVFLGTDEWERWPKHPEFSDYVDTHFKDGAGWNFISVERTIRILESSDIAWFDEVVLSEQHGRMRGTGVLTRQGGKWEIAHYALSFLILNENWDEVVELTKITKERLEQKEP